MSRTPTRLRILRVVCVLLCAVTAAVFAARAVNMRMYADAGSLPRADESVRCQKAIYPTVAARHIRSHIRSALKIAEKALKPQRHFDSAHITHIITEGETK